MLKSELSNLEERVGIILNLKEIINTGDTNAGRGPIWDRFKNACAELKQRMVNEVFGPAKDHVIRRYVQFHQAGLVTLSDAAFQQLKITDEPTIPGKSELLVRVLQSLQELLDFIAQKFYHYFDVIHPISNYKSDQIGNDFRTKIETLAPLLFNHQIERSLVDVFLLSIEECLDLVRVQGITHEQYHYIEELLQLITRHLAEAKATTDSFADLLYRYNFNSAYFEVWYREERLPVSLRRTGEEMQLQKIEPVTQRLGIVPGRKPLDMLLREWLIAVNAYQGGAATLKKQETAVPRLPLILSVPQLALFVRLCYLEGCFQISNISHIMRFFTEHFETKKQPNISLKSFSRAFYSSDQATAAMVRDFLQRMISMIDKTYFPKT